MMVKRYISLPLIYRFDLKSRSLASNPFNGNDINAFAMLNDQHGLLVLNDGAISQIDLKAETKTDLDLRAEFVRGTLEAIPEHNTVIGLTSDRQVLILKRGLNDAISYLPISADELVCVMSLSSDNSHLAVVTNKQTLRLYETAEFSENYSGKVGADYDWKDCSKESAIAFSSDGDTVAASAGETIEIRRTKDGKLLQQLLPDVGAIDDLILSSDGRYLYFVNDFYARGGDIYRYDLVAKSPMTSINSGSVNTSLLEPNAEGTIFVSSGANWGIETWDTNTGSYLAGVSLAAQPIDIVLNPKGGNGLITFLDGQIFVFQLPYEESGSRLSEIGCQNIPFGRRFSITEMSDPFLAALLSKSERDLCN